MLVTRIAARVFDQSALLFYELQMGETPPDWNPSNGLAQWATPDEDHLHPRHTPLGSPFSRGIDYSRPFNSHFSQKHSDPLLLVPESRVHQHAAFDIRLRHRRQPDELRRAENSRLPASTSDAASVVHTL